MLIQPLERRRLLHADISVLVNFQPQNTYQPHGMLIDYGAVYGTRTGGWTYGWSSDATKCGIDRNQTNDQKIDTFITMQTPTAKRWDMAVENGEYQVFVSAGDGKVWNDKMAISVEGKTAVSGTTTSAKRYLTGTVDVTVLDGKLTINNAAGAVNNKIDYITIRSVEQTTAHTLNVVAATPTAKETGLVAGKFTVTRGGDLDAPVTVPLTIGGTATAGSDYTALPSSVTFPAGVASVDLLVKPLADNMVEPAETVTVTLGATGDYTLVEPTATVTIQDAAAVSTGTNLTWGYGANRPVAASELIGGAVGNKLYSFGGFVDTTYKPTKAAYAYDVTTNTWSRLADLPVGLTHAGVAIAGTNIYFAGGYPGSGTSGYQVFSTTAVWKYDTVAGTYTAMPSLPAARGAGSLAIVGNTMYFLGGDNSSRQDVTTVYALDLGNLAAGWVTKASLPASRNHAAAVTVNGSLYLMGGQTAQDAALTTHADVYRYDATADQWIACAPMPGGRSHITDATFVYNNKVIVVAGQSAFESPLSSVLQYDPLADSWTTLASLPAARFSGVSDIVGGKIVYAAGYNGAVKANTYVATIG